MISKSHIRGALTTGSKWHFVVVDLDPDGDGAKYLVSELIEIPRGNAIYAIDPLALTPALSAGILSTWLMFATVRFNRAFQEFTEDQWFTMQPESEGES